MQAVVVERGRREEGSLQRENGRNERALRFEVEVDPHDNYTCHVYKGLLFQPNMKSTEIQQIQNDHTLYALGMLC